MIVCGVRSRPLVPEEVRRVSCWLKKNAAAHSIFFIEEDARGYYSSIVMLSGLPQGNFLIVEGNSVPDFSGDQNRERKFLITSMQNNGTIPDRSWEKVAEFDSYYIFSKK
jgi:hypothetical protein